MLHMTCWQLVTRRRWGFDIRGGRWGGRRGPQAGGRSLFEMFEGVIPNLLPSEEISQNYHPDWARGWGGVEPTRLLI